jgi:hypothetical protein
MKIHKINIPQLLHQFPQLREMAHDYYDWLPVPVPEVIPFSEHDREALMILRMLTRNMMEPGKTFSPSERFEAEIKFLSGKPGIYSGRAMADYVTHLEFPEVVTRPGSYMGFLDFKIKYKDRRLAEAVRMFCANRREYKEDVFMISGFRKNDDY